MTYALFSITLGLVGVAFGLLHCGARLEEIRDILLVEDVEGPE